ncbi:hypothetical protein [Arthrobacter humicola]
MTGNFETPHFQEIRGEQPLQISEDLNGAVATAVAHAMDIGGHGVLVTQHSPTFYTVSLSRDVPYGQIRERRATESITTGRH